MIWYKFHVGDYIIHTLHLADAEDLAYRRLLDLYYMTEKPIPNDLELVCKKVRLDAEVVEPVLKEFFKPTSDGWVNQRCDQEINQYTKFVDRMNKISKKGVKIRQAKAAQRQADKGSQTDDTRLPNGDPNGNHMVDQMVYKTETETETDKNIKTPSTASTAFDEFWSVWPPSKRKVAKGACRARWEQKKLNRFAAIIVAHVRAMKNSAQWREGFEPAPLTYLNQARWEDPVDASPDPFATGRSA